MAEAVAPNGDRPAATQEMAEIATPGQHSIDDICNFLDCAANSTVKTLIVNGEEDDSLIALVLRGDHELNDIKAEKLEGVANPLTFASEQAVLAATGCSVGSLGPVGLSIPVIIDLSAAHLSDFVCGANKESVHLTGVNWQRDCAAERVEDLRNVLAGDPSPDGQGTLEIKRGIEVGHIFQLGTKYSDAMNAKILDENGKEQAMLMGCYGIGVSRIVASAIEQNHDDKGIIWPESLAPFQLAIIPINPHKSEAVREASETLYTKLRETGHEVLLMDEKKARLGVMLADVELMGIPHRLVIGDRGLENDAIEYKYRRDAESSDIKLSELDAFLAKALSSE